jgi:hypothetical protein
MATNLAIDDSLLDEALSLGAYKTKKDTVNAALREFVKVRRSSGIIDLFGTVDFDEGYDYKEARRRD